MLTEKANRRQNLGLGRGNRRAHKFDFYSIFLECLFKKGFEQCWDWPGTITAMGYGQTWIDGRMALAHRAAFELYYGPIAPGMFGCHTCDRPICFNPKHVVEGSHEYNMADMARKGRRNDKLTVEQREAVRGDPRPLEVVAAEYGIAISTVSTYQSGKKGRYIQAAAAQVKRRIGSGPQKLTAETARAIYYDKRTVRVIAEEYGVASPTVVGIKNGQYWPHIHQEALVRGDANVKKPDGSAFDNDTLLAIYFAEGSQSAIACEFGTTQATVSRIKHRVGCYDAQIDAALDARKDAAA